MSTRTQYAVIPRISPLNTKSAWVYGNTSATTPTGNSTNLASLARFQQKQLEEKEQKLLQLYDQQQQRAHRVAQRGSAGSNGSHSDANSAAAKTRHIFTDRRQNQKAKGIDKSYPLEPLESGNKRGAGSSRQNLIKAGQSVGQVGSRKRLADENRRDVVNGNRLTPPQESSCSYPNNNNSSSSQVARKGFSNDTAVGHNEAQTNDGPSIEQKQNGNHYEINIDEVIDNDAMERNRMVARYSMESEVRHRGYVTEARRVVESASYSEKILNDVSNTQVGKSSVTVVSVPKRSGQTEVKTETRSRNSSISRQEGLAKKQSEVEQASRFADTTESTSFKINKVLQNRKKSSLLIGRSRKIDIKRESSPPVQSTSLVCEVVENHPVAITQVIEDKKKKESGVKGIVMKIESAASGLFRRRAVEQRSTLEHSSSNEIERKDRSVHENVNVIDDKRSGEGSPTMSTSRGACQEFKKIPPLECPRSSQFVSLADMRMKNRSLSESPERTFSYFNEDNHARRASYESKRLLFEQLSSQESISRRSSLIEPSVGIEIETMTPAKATLSTSSDRLSRETSRSRESMKSSRQIILSASADRLAKKRSRSVESMKLCRRASRASPSPVRKSPTPIGIEIRAVSPPKSILSSSTDRLARERSRSKESVKLCRRNSMNERKNASPSPVRKSRDCSRESSCSRSRSAHRCSCCANEDMCEGEDCQLKGFQRTTSSFRAKTSKEKVPGKTAGNTVAGKKVATSAKGVEGKPILAKVSSINVIPRDTMVLTRDSVKTKSALSPGKDKLNSRGVTRKQSSYIDRIEKQNDDDDDDNDDDDDGGEVKKSSYLRNPVTRLRSVFLVKPTYKNKRNLSSAKKPVNLDSILNKKSNSNGKASDSTVRKSFSVYTPLRNVENYNEQQNNQLSSRNSSSLKILNKIVESNAYVNENKPTPAPRKSSVGGTGDSDEKPITPAARRLSSGLTTETSRSTNFSSLRSSTHDKAKLNTAKQDSGIGELLTTCKICKRHFNNERIGLHERICAKTAQKKRKQFDATTQRVKGTELEEFAPKPVNKKQGKNTKPEPIPPPATSKSNWRRKHEDFINAIRSAKQVQTHLNSGGKLSDLPPPPPSDTSDYVKCPHCSRKFNQTAAERHIPKCETMQHNKAPNRQSRAPLKAKR